ncbi:hypothetical protein HZB07_06870 [Candidatus Saganbacteria bacterium]|nr:hypothetical protein [Candidatus Saganbacteria bacterium]
MKISSRIILIISLCFIGFIFLWAIYAPKEDLSQRIYRALKEQSQKADLAFKEVTFEEVAAGVKYWQLTAKTAAANNSTKIISLKDASGTFFKAGHPVLRFRSPAALWDMAEKEIILDQPLGYDVQLDKKISVLSRDLKTSSLSVFNFPEFYQKNQGYWFQSKNLSWKLADEKLLCTGGIVFNKGDLVGYADQLEGDVALENILLKGEPRFIINPKDVSPITLEAESIKIFSINDELLAQGNPLISWQTARISALNMRFTQRDKIIHLKDRVKIDYNDIQASGNAAIYLTKEEKIILSGRAQASQGGNSLTGDEVLVFLKDKQISVIGKGKIIINEEKVR